MDNRFKLQSKASAIYIIIAFFLILMLQELVIGPMTTTEEKVPYSRFRKDLASGEIAEVVVEPERILYSVKDSDGESKAKNVRIVVRIEDGSLVEELVEAGIALTVPLRSSAIKTLCFRVGLPPLLRAPYLNLGLPPTNFSSISMMPFSGGRSTDQASIICRIAWPIFQAVLWCTPIKRAKNTEEMPLLELRM